MLLFANQVVIMPITYSGGYVQIKGTAFTHLIVRHPQDTHDSEQRPSMKVMWYSTREHGLHLIYLPCTCTNKVHDKTRHSLKGL